MQYIDTKSMDDDDFMALFENRVNETIREFNLFDRDQKLLVAASGGKDSTALLYFLKKFGYDVEAITINSHIGCYSDESLENLKKFCSKEKIKLFEISLEKEFGYKLCHIMAIMEAKGLNKTSCSVCGTLRRYLLNKYGKKIGAKVLLTGHNLDDETDGILMALFSGNVKQIARIGPTSSSNSGNFVRRVKPLYFIFEDEVERYSRIKKFDVHYGWCPCSANASRRFYCELDISPEKKFNITNNIISIIPKLKNNLKSKSEMRLCDVCNQPTSHDICQTCKILSVIEDPSVNKLRLNESIKKFEVLHNTCEVKLKSA